MGVFGIEKTQAQTNQKYTALRYPEAPSCIPHYSRLEIARKVVRSSGTRLSFICSSNKAVHICLRFSQSVLGHYITLQYGTVILACSYYRLSFLNTAKAALTRLWTVRAGISRICEISRKLSCSPQWSRTASLWHWS